MSPYCFDHALKVSQSSLEGNWKKYSYIMIVFERVINYLVYIAQER
jgi:hypothetical protein